MSQQQILLLGAYGQRNLGDDALLEVFLDQLHDARIVVNSARPEETSQRYGLITSVTSVDFDDIAITVLPASAPNAP